MQSGMPILPGRHDHTSGTGTLDRHDRLHGGLWTGRDRIRRGRPAQPVQRGPLRDHRDHRTARRPLRGHEHLAVTAEHPRRRLQHRPGQRTLAQRTPIRAHLRSRGRLGTDAQGHQQAGHRAGPHRHRGHGLRPRMASGEAVLHVWAAHRDRRGRPGDQGHGRARHRGRSQGLGTQGHPVHDQHRRVHPQTAHPVPVGDPGPCRGHRRTSGTAQGDHSLRPTLWSLHRHAISRRTSGDDRGTALTRGPPGGTRHRSGVARRWHLRRVERALLLRAVGGVLSTRTGTPGGVAGLVHHPGT